jgi:hypothetical protein
MGGLGVSARNEVRESGERGPSEIEEKLSQKRRGSRYFKEGNFIMPIVSNPYDLAA